MLLEATDIGKSYQAGSGILTVLDHVSLTVDTGERVGLVGGSGSGKSTLASILTGLETADGGRVSFGGCACHVAHPRTRWPRSAKEAWLGMQMVFQHPVSSFSPRMRIGTAVAEGIVYRGHTRQECAKAATEALELVGLSASYAERYPWELSGGECQRAAVARAVISRPQLLICDEPTSSLDVTVQAQVVELIHRLCSDLNMACLFISHNLALVQGLCPRTYVIDQGVIVEEGPTDMLFGRPRSPATQRLVEAVATL